MDLVVESFKARSDDGKYETTIVITRSVKDARSHDNPDAAIPGLKSALTVNGYRCNFIEDGVFKVVNDPRRPGVVVRRVTDG